MAFRLLTDATVILHFAFLAFVVGGGFLVRRYRWLMVPHLLAVAWGVYVEAMGGMVCPLTPLENHFARLAGGEGYEGGYIEHYLVPILYPDGLTPAAQRRRQITFTGGITATPRAPHAWTISNGRWAASRWHPILSRPWP